MKPRAPLLSSPSNSPRTFTSQERLLAGTGAQFHTAPVKYTTIFELDEELRSKDPNDHTGPVYPERDKGSRSRSGRKGVPRWEQWELEQRKLEQRKLEQREFDDFVRRNGRACATCRLRKVKDCTND